MAAKVQETENKKASKARNREGERGQWWPCETTDTELRELQSEGMISAYWSFIRDTVVPKPGAGEVVMTKAWVERGLSLPCSEFFLSILTTYGLQPHNIPNSYLLLSNFATLCEGHLGIRPDVKLWQFFFRVKKETKDKAMLELWEHDIHAPTWSSLHWRRKTYAPFFASPSGDTAEEVPEDEEEEEEPAPRKVAPRPTKRPRAKASAPAGASGEASAKKPKVIKPPPLDSRKAERERLKMLSTTGKRSRPNIPAPRLRLTATRTASQKPITEFMKKSPAVGPPTPAPPSASHTALSSPPQRIVSPPRKHSTGDNSGREKVGGEDPKAKGPAQEEIQDQGEAEVTSSEKSHSDTLKRRNKFPRDDVLSLAGDDCKDLISASRKICHNLSLKRSRTCLRKLIKRMDILPELVTDLQASSARGAAAMTLTMCLAHNPKMDLDRVSSGVPPTADVGKLLDAVSGYDTRIARRIRHEEFYDKVVLPSRRAP
ncbi:hypothetical protein QYE76_068546 [Lolium multiflorum]|uniref:Transposase (putative) gypsy type domain-containing protein n=1 Tax=Lolium multiflorum TaxID=4521 RepID=A0AAD8SG07_LOLMU|nr:hypothetical protein QYE76_068546 [Lolium multiflorum]